MFKQFNKALIQGLTIVGAIALIVILATPAHAESNVKLLMGKVGSSEVYISNVACKNPLLIKDYPYQAIVINREMQKAAPGCWKNVTLEKEDFIHIQWTATDFSELPANLFLIQPVPAKPAYTPPPDVKVDM